jgi:hypothetical protein
MDEVMPNHMKLEPNLSESVFKGVCKFVGKGSSRFPEV